MRVKGRRQSPNVEDIRAPYAAARHSVQFETDREWPIRDIDAQAQNKADALKVQATFAPYKSLPPEDIMKQNLRKMATPNEFGYSDLAIERVGSGWEARAIQANIRDTWFDKTMDALGMEMLLGDRWKD